MDAMNQTSILLLNDLLAIETAINIYKKQHSLWQDWSRKSVLMDASEFLPKVSKHMTVQRLRSIVYFSQAGICLVSGTKQVFWHNSNYKLGKYSLSQIEFIYVENDDKSHFFP
ncbi:MAG: hypothetical protein KME09_01045 [Pleurocapsa minor HA4230-MV1]|jgi:hypothetical protein|nr:hypothetical protein [Pleurocapsa minor HA4230-MV1]